MMGLAAADAAGRAAAADAGDHVGRAAAADAAGRVTVRLSARLLLTRAPLPLIRRPEKKPVPFKEPGF
jgi:hypothetical protein